MKFRLPFKSKKKSKNRRAQNQRVLDVKLNARQRRRLRALKTAWIVLLLSLTMVATYLSYQGAAAVWDWAVADNPYFTLRHIQIQSDGILNHDQIRTWAGLHSSMNLFDIDLQRVRRDLEIIPIIASAQVERVLPDILRIRIRERESVARIPAPPGETDPSLAAMGIYTLDRTGFCMYPPARHHCQVPSQASVEHLPLLLGIPAQDLRPGHQLHAPQVLLALQWLDSFQRSPMTGRVQIKSLDLQTLGCAEATTLQNAKILFSDQSLDRQMLRWHQIQETFSRRGQLIASLNLSITNHVPVTVGWPVPESAAEPVPAAPAPTPSPSANPIPNPSSKPKPTLNPTSTPTRKKHV